MHGISPHIARDRDGPRAACFTAPSPRARHNRVLGRERPVLGASWDLVKLRPRAVEVFDDDAGREIRTATNDGESGEEDDAAKTVECQHISTTIEGRKLVIRELALSSRSSGSRPGIGTGRSDRQG